MNLSRLPGFLKTLGIVVLFFLIGIDPAFSVENEKSANDIPYSVTIPAKTEILKTLRKEHPRLLVSPQEMQRIKTLIDSDAEAGKIYEAVKKRADEILEEPVIERKIVHRSQPTMLDTSRTCLRRIVDLGTMYRLTGEKKYLDRAMAEMTAACRFEDWNHRCFLDTAEMTTAIAIGYDWFYNDLSDEQRLLFRQSIRDLGLVHGREAYQKKTSWTRTRFNWNQVCAGGMIVGALAVAEDEPDLAAEMIELAANGVQVAMREFAPDGGTSEGPGYWTYALNYTAYMIGSLDSALGTDFGLSEFPGFSETGRLRIHLITPLKTQFTYGDGGARTDSSAVMYWLAKKFNRPEYAKRDSEVFERTSAYHLWWFPSENLMKKSSDTISEEPLAAKFVHAGLIFMRSAWEPNAVYLGVKGGTNNCGHPHLELGHFQLISDSTLWLTDLGGVSYTPEYFSKKRWTFYRATNLAHNVPIIDGALQDPKAKVEITDFSSKGDQSIVTLDMTDAFRNQVEKAYRRFTLDGRTLLVEDRFVGTKGNEIVWQVHCPARRILINEKNPRQVDMQHLYKRMRMELLEPKDAQFEIQEIEIPEGQPPVKDMTRLVIRRKIENQDMKIDFKVRFTPQEPAPKREDR